MNRIDIKNPSQPAQTATKSEELSYPTFVVAIHRRQPKTTKSDKWKVLSAVKSEIKTTFLTNSVNSRFHHIKKF